MIQSAVGIGMRREILGRGILSFVAVFWAIGGFWADFNQTHVFNPAWLPHARFHAAFDLVFTIGVAAIAVRLVWSNQLLMGAFLASLYPASFFVTALFPGVAFADPDQPLPTLWGIPIQLVTAAVTLGLAAVGYYLARLSKNAKPHRTVSRGGPSK
jgi:hypothetical protein